MGAPACNRPRVRVAALMLLDNRVVLVRHRKAGASYYLLPGGGVEYGESLSDALRREVLEETGLAITVGQPLLINDTIDPEASRHLVNITFSAEITGGEITVPADDVRVEGVETVDPAALSGLDLRPPIAAELRDVLTRSETAPVTYIGPRFIPG